MQRQIKLKIETLYLPLPKYNILIYGPISTILHRNRCNNHSPIRRIDGIVVYAVNTFFDFLCDRCFHRNYFQNRARAW